jgi:hypothetical protein
MPAAEADYIRIRKKDVLSLFLLILVFVGGYFLNDFIKGKASTSDKNTCMQFCNLAGLEFAFVKDGSCYCYQRQIFYNQQQNKTVEIYFAANAGIIKNITVTEGLSLEARNMLTSK